MNRFQTHKQSIGNLKPSKLTLQETDLFAADRFSAEARKSNKLSNKENQKEHNLLLDSDQGNSSRTGNPEKYFSFGNNPSSDSLMSNRDEHGGRIKKFIPLLPLDHPNQRTIPRSSKAQTARLFLEDSDTVSDKTTKQDPYNNTSSQIQCALNKSRHELIRTHQPDSKPHCENISSKKNLLADLINMIDGKNTKTELNAQFLISRKKPCTAQSVNITSENKTKNDKSCTSRDALENFDSEKGPSSETSRRDSASHVQIPQARFKGANSRSRSISCVTRNKTQDSSISNIETVERKMSLKTDASDRSIILQGVASKTNGVSNPEYQVCNNLHQKRRTKSSNEGKTERPHHMRQNTHNSNTKNKSGSISVSPIKRSREQSSNNIRTYEDHTIDPISHTEIDLIDSADRIEAREINKERSIEFEIEEKPKPSKEKPLKNFKGSPSSLRGAPEDDLKKSIGTSQDLFDQMSINQEHRISTLKNDNIMLRGKLQFFEKENDALKEQNTKLRNALNHQNDSFDKLQSQIKELKTKLERERQRNNKLGTENSDLKASYNTLEKELAFLGGVPDKKTAIFFKEPKFSSNNEFDLEPLRSDLDNKKIFKSTRKSPQKPIECVTDRDLETLKILRDLTDYKKSTERFISCVTKIVVDCTPTDYSETQKPDLKLVWKFIKKMMTEFMTTKKESQFLKKNEEILQKCLDILLLEDRADLPMKIQEILAKRNRLSKILSKLKLHFNLSAFQTLEDLEKFLFQNSSM